jgi:hypothetical protein
MAQYNIAANLRDRSPVSAMLEGRAQTDAHRINQQTIERNEITMPYVKQLTEQKVAMNEKAIEQWEIEREFYKTGLEQEQQIRSQAIEAQKYQLEQAERAKQFEEDRASGLYTDEELIDKHGMLGLDWKMQQLGVEEAEKADFVSKLRFIQSGATPEAREAIYQQVIADAPEDMRGYFPEQYTGHENTFEQMLDALDQRTKSADVQLFELYEKYSDPNHPRYNPALADNIERMIVQRSMGVGTATEREAERSFPTLGVTALEAYKAANNEYGKVMLQHLKDSLGPRTPMDATIANAMNYDYWINAADDPETKARLMVDFAGAQEAARVSAGSYMDPDLVEWHRQRFNDYWNRSISREEFLRREFPPKPEEDTAQDEPVGDVMPDGNRYVAGREYEIGGETYIYRGNRNFEKITNTEGR